MTNMTNQGLNKASVTKNQVQGLNTLLSNGQKSGSQNRRMSLTRNKSNDKSQNNITNNTLTKKSKKNLEPKKKKPIARLKTPEQQIESLANDQTNKSPSKFIQTEIRTKTFDPNDTQNIDGKGSMGDTDADESIPAEHSKLM